MMEWESSLTPGSTARAFAGVVWGIDVSTENILDVGRRTTYLGVLQCLEEGCDPHESDLVVPHDSVGFAISVTRNLKLIFVYCSICQSDSHCLQIRSLTVESIPASLL